MFAKLLAIILSFAVLGCVLLVNRQQQIEAAHEMSLVHTRLAANEQAIWQLRADIARGCSPDHLHAAKNHLAEQWMAVHIDQPAAPRGYGHGDGDDNMENLGG